LHDAARFRARSTSHSVAALGGCTNIPLAAVRAQEDETNLEYGFLGHAKVRFVHLDPPGLLKSWKIKNSVSVYQAAFMTAPSMTTPAVTYFQSATSSFRASATIVVFL
jgi:hypothetical protein